MRDPVSNQEIDLTPDMLTEAFDKSLQIANKPVVTDIKLSELGESGALSSMLRLSLSYSGTDLGPSSVVIKFQSALEPIRQLAKNADFYHREVMFYTDLADESIKTPDCYLSRYDANSGNFLLVLEDMHGNRLGNMFNSSVEDVETAISTLANWHAAWWNNDKLRSIPWLWSVSSKDIAKGYEETLRSTVPAALQKFGDIYGSSFRAYAEKMASSFTKIASLYRQREMTLVHGDLHLQQIFFGTDTTDEPTFYDWQTVVKGFPGEDLARPISFNLTKEDRRNHEHNLLALYVEQLTVQGVTGYGVEDALYDYRLGQKWNAVMNLNAGSVADPDMLALNWNVNVSIAG